MRYGTDLGHRHALRRISAQPLREYAGLLGVVWSGIHHLRSLYRRRLSVDAESAETGKPCGRQSQEHGVHADLLAPKSRRRRRRTTRLATPSSTGRPSGRCGGQVCDSNVRELYWFHFLRTPAKAITSGPSLATRRSNVSDALAT